MSLFPLLKRPLLALLLLLPWSAGAVVKLELAPPAYKFGDLEGGGTAQAAFDVQISGLDNGTPGDTSDDIAVAAYDFGLIYDRSIMTLASFGGFTDRLGDPTALFEVENADPLEYDSGPPETGNSLWDYRADHPSPSLGAYEGPVLGVPDITPGGTINEGSLRFSQASFLFRDELLALQEPDVNNTLVLFSLIFDVDTREQNHKRSTPLRFVDDRDYADWTGDPNTGLLDVKLSTEDDLDALDSRYLDRSNATVSVPVPGAMWLVGLGLGVLGACRLRRRSHGL
ncbi:hypothetical protein CKO31_03300 [Thiohalocapsa halophila]|uniref:PEP-CTERM sorting domain-containing protein n=1 Tax=Thiohalocapsa halophila TaxID=69359 RepID=A0ABS1CCZ9_9GAMM|nr:hypothetical protein [Thiohalocapsa halophila]MBK1629782.1 hypothetical protein [Thiohalocapsa halophila]